MSAATVFGLDPKTYVPHAVHRGDRAWPETNCFVDLVVEVLHAAGLEPLAAMPFIVGVDLEGDQFTFFKPPFGDLLELYGIDVIELNVWDDLVGHLVDQARQGRVSLVEVDAHHLPDTAGVTYRSGHAKTTVGVESIDVDARTLRYFHNAGHFALEGDDFDGVFSRGRDPGAPYLPPYVEVAKLGRVVRRTPDELARVSRALLARHLARRPERNPLHAFAARFPEDLARTTAGGMDRFHAYAFATLRQIGAAFELFASYLAWLAAIAGADLSEAEARFAAIATGAKSVQFRVARAVASGKPLDTAPISRMGDAWDEGMASLERFVARGA